ncbi:hypothetical protein WJX72_007257 [[Myrmecia] bisecta]|uniref:Uncharacterized protein n=1 Tax=[Myrmecia] bisecta TaxID=41462 RepID=A0AAW1QFI0_9CHLO
MGTYNQLFAVYAQARKAGHGPAAPYPVLALDEANVLYEWQQGDAQQQNDLRALLRYFVKVSKQEQEAHVILVTSAYGFQSWLCKEIGVQFHAAHVIGDFDELAAKAFFTEHALPAMRGVVGKVDVEDASWETIFEVCGGNAGLLLSAAAASESDWALGLRDVWREIMEKVRSGLRSPSGWATQQYITATKQLLAASYHAVNADDLAEALGDDGAAALDAMVKGKLLAYCPESAWARDVPVDAFDALSTNLDPREI